MMPDFACARCRAELPEYSAGTLPEAARQRVERHLRTCSRCRDELAAWSVLGAAVRNSTTPPPELPFSQAWDSLHAALTVSSASQTARATGKGDASMNDHHLSTTTIPSVPSSASGPEDRPPFSSTRGRAGAGRVQAFAAVAAVLALIVVSAAIFTALARQRLPASHGSGTVTPNPASTQTVQAGITVKVFFSRHPQSDNDPTLVFAVTRSSPTAGVATFAIGQLIAGPTQTEQNQGFYTPLSASLQGTSSCGGADFTLTLDHRGARSEAGTATLQFCRETLLAGDLTGARITAEITSTLEQFSTIHQVVILNQSGYCFNDLSGQNRCLQ
jgi:hypothetical protein